MEAEYCKSTEGGATFKASGFVGDATALQARVELAYFNLGDKQPELAELDVRLTEHNRSRWALLNQAINQGSVAV